LKERKLSYTPNPSYHCDQCDRSENGPVCWLKQLKEIRKPEVMALWSNLRATRALLKQGCVKGIGKDCSDQLDRRPRVNL